MSEPIIEIHGLNEVLTQLWARPAEVRQRAARVLYREALVIQRRSMERTPVKTGALRGSHATTTPDLSARDVGVTVSVGGPAAPYAVFVHENLEAHHPVGQAKFLESAAREHGPALLQALRTEIAR